MELLLEFTQSQIVNSQSYNEKKLQKNEAFLYQAYFCKFFVISYLNSNKMKII